MLDCSLNSLIFYKHLRILHLYIWGRFDTICNYFLLKALWVFLIFPLLVSRIFLKAMTLHPIWIEGFSYSTGLILTYEIQVGTKGRVGGRGDIGPMRWDPILLSHWTTVCLNKGLASAAEYTYPLAFCIHEDAHALQTLSLFIKRHTQLVEMLWTEETARQTYFVFCSSRVKVIWQHGGWNQREKRIQTLCLKQLTSGVSLYQLATSQQAICTTVGFTQFN